MKFSIFTGENILCSFRNGDVVYNDSNVDKSSYCKYFDRAPLTSDIDKHLLICMLNLYLTNGFSNRYHLGEFTFIFRGFR